MYSLFNRGSLPIQCTKNASMVHIKAKTFSSLSQPKINGPVYLYDDFERAPYSEKNFFFAKLSKHHTAYILLPVILYMQ